LNSPSYETLKNAIKKNRTKQQTTGNRQPRDKKSPQKTDEKPPTFFVMSPDAFFRVFELPLLLVAKRPKSALKKID
jgi:hypothetical protein